MTTKKHPATPAEAQPGTDVKLVAILEAIKNHGTDIQMRYAAVSLLPEISAIINGTLINVDFRWDEGVSLEAYCKGGYRPTLYAKLSVAGFAMYSRLTVAPTDGYIHLVVEAIEIRKDSQQTQARRLALAALEKVFEM